MVSAADFKDYYTTLKVSKTATPAEIKAAYRKLARKHHPDLNPDHQEEAEKQFKEINEAHEVLSDPDKRQKYDQFGQYWEQASKSDVPPSAKARSAGVDVGGFDPDQYSNFNDFINDLLGRTRGTQGSGRRVEYRTSPSSGSGFEGDFRSQESASDIEAAILLTFGEAFEGVQKRLQVNDEMINIRIPPGAKARSRIRIKGKGYSSPFSQQRGDLYLNIELHPHSFFRFEGDNLVCDIPITPDEAVLGTQVKVPTPDGSVTMTIPAGINSGQSLRLRGKGWSQPKGGRSDQIIKILVVTPQEISSLERECYEKIRANRSFNPRTNLDEVKL